MPSLRTLTPPGPAPCAGFHRTMRRVGALATVIRATDTRRHRRALYGRLRRCGCPRRPPPLRATAP